MVSRNMLSERLGRWVFWLMFIGFNVAFLPMHLTGLLGMPRRVWTYPSALGWEGLNLVSTIGAFILALGVLIFVIDLVLRFRPGEGPRNPWKAGTLEWIPNDVYSTRSIPHVASREPLWDQPNLSDEVERGHHYLPNAPTGGRETIVTTAVDARPEYLIQMPGPGWTPFIAAVFTAAFFLLLTVKVVVPALVCAIVAIGAIFVWVWGLDPGPSRTPVEIGGGLKLPVYMTGPTSHSWWAMIVLMFVAGSLFIAFVFSYLYLWIVSPEVWAPLAAPVPSIEWPAASAALFVASIAAFLLGWGSLSDPGSRSGLTPVLMLAGTLCAIAAVGADVYGQWQTGLRPSSSSYAAMVYMANGLTGQLVFAAALMSAFTLARHFTGRLDAVRRATFDNTALLFFYAAGQGLVGLLLVHGFPRLIG
jgi:cytochrome c oxidase subunit I+III